MSKLPQIKFGFTAKQIITEGRVIQNGIDSIKKWLENERIPQLTEEQVILFLLSCGNDEESTKSTIKAFYNIRNGSPDLFNNRKIEREDLQKQLNTGRFCILPERTDDGSAIMFYKFYDTYYYNFELGPFLMLLFMALDATLHDHPPKGLIILYDMKGIGLMHMTRLRLGYLRTYFQYLQEGLPVKLKSFHFLNTVYFIEKIMKLVRPLAKQEVLDMMHFHTSDIDMEVFYENCIPRKCLPEDYGGDLPTVQELHEKTIQTLANLQTHFDAEELQRTDIDL